MSSSDHSRLDNVGYDLVLETSEVRRFAFNAGLAAAT
jgi:hypothetical protein